MSTCSTVQPVSSGGSLDGRGRGGRTGGGSWCGCPAASGPRREDVPHAAEVAEQAGAPARRLATSSSSSRAARSASESTRAEGTRSLKMRTPWHVDRRRSRAARAGRAARSRRTGAAAGRSSPQRPSGAARAARAWANCPARARARTTAQPLRGDEARGCRPGRGPGAMPASAASGSSTTSSVPWQQTRSTPAGRPTTSSATVSASPCTAVIGRRRRPRRPGGPATPGRRGWGRRRRRRARLGERAPASAAGAATEVERPAAAGRASALRLVGEGPIEPPTTAAVRRPVSTPRAGAATARRPRRASVGA